MSTLRGGPEQPGRQAKGWPEPVRMLVATASVSVTPSILLALLLPDDLPHRTWVALGLALVLSAVLARLGAVWWARHRGSGEVLFVDLMLTGWIRRRRSLRKLEHFGALLPGDLAQGRTFQFAELVGLSKLLERRDGYTHGHSRRVARHAERIAQRLGLPAATVDEVRIAGLVHDVGKLGVDPAILRKPGRLTDAEFAAVKTHAALGAQMLRGLTTPAVVAMVRHHHERLDGTGYPTGLAGAGIPIGARILAVADTFDAITSTRSYRARRSHRQGLDILRKEAGTQLDGDVVAAFASYYTGARPALWSTFALAAPARVVAAIADLLRGAAGVPAAVAQGLPAVALAALAVGATGTALVEASAPSPARERPAASGPTATTGAGPGTTGAGGAGRIAEPDRAAAAPGPRLRPISAPGSTRAGGGAAGKAQSGRSPAVAPTAARPGSPAVPGAAGNGATDTGAAPVTHLPRPATGESGTPPAAAKPTPVPPAVAPVPIPAPSASEPGAVSVPATTVPVPAVTIATPVATVSTPAVTVTTPAVSVTSSGATATAPSAAITVPAVTTPAGVPTPAGIPLPG